MSIRSIAVKVPGTVEWYEIDEVRYMVLSKGNLTKQEAIEYLKTALLKTLDVLNKEDFKVYDNYLEDIKNEV